MLHEKAQDVDPGAVDRLHSMTLSESAGTTGSAPSRPRLSMFLVATAAAVTVGTAAAVLLPVTGGGEGRTPERTGSAGSAVDCVSAFRFEGRSYLTVLEDEVDADRIGPRLGAGRFAPCDDGEETPGADSPPSDRRAVFALAEVPLDHAVVLRTGDVGSVLVAQDGTTDGWDADLQAFLEEAGSPLAD